MPEKAKHEAMDNVEKFKQFKRIYHAAEWSETLSDSFFKKHGIFSTLHNSLSHTERPLLGPNYTDIPVDFELDCSLLHDCHSKNLPLLITPIELHAFRGNIDAVKQLLKWGADIKYAIHGFKAAGHFDTEKNTSRFLQAIESLSFRAKIADAADDLHVAEFKIEKHIPKFQL